VAAKPYDFSSLQFLASVGEPLNPEAVVWSEEVFGQPFHDNWWQTETGGIMIANRPGMEVRPGSMGSRFRASRRGSSSRTEEGLRELGPGEIGELALRPGWPSMMRAYLMRGALREVFRGRLVPVGRSRDAGP
jgi:acetyl-CoA synthetase